MADPYINLKDIIFPSNPVVNQRENCTITSLVYLSEVRYALFDIEPWKAPGFDGFQPKFF